MYIKVLNFLDMSEKPDKCEYLNTNINNYIDRIEIDGFKVLITFRSRRILKELMPHFKNCFLMIIDDREVIINRDTISYLKSTNTLVLTASEIKFDNTIFTYSKY